jgi:hypothetical protein
MLVTVERAACNALRAWLAAKLSDVEVRDTWPDDDKPLPARAVSILLIGKAADEWTTPRAESHEDVHDAIPAAIELDPAAIVDTPSANTALNTLRSRFLAHLADTAAHAAADMITVVTAPAVVDLSSVAQGIALANDLRSQLPAHALLVGPHIVADDQNAPTAPAATNAATLLELTVNLVETLGAHFAARLYTWLLGARVAPVQLDVWATYEAAREDVIARLEKAIRVGRDEITGADIFEQDCPVGLSTSVRLGDNWTAGDNRAAFDFEAPTREGDAQTNEWRATYYGTADVPMLAKAQSARLARIRIETILAGTAGPTLDIAAADNADGFTDTITSD